MEWAETNALWHLMLSGLCLVCLLVWHRLRLLRLEAEIQGQRQLQLEEQWRQSLVAKDEYMARLSHEIRNPLHAVIGLIRRLQRGVVPDEGILESLRAAADYLESTVDEVLNFSMAMSGRLAPRPTMFPVVELLRTVLELYRPLAERKGLALQLRCNCPEDRVLYADRFRIQQIIGNLLNNAVKFTDKGTVEIRLDLVSDGSGSRLRIAVADSGPGMDLSTQERIFDPLPKGWAGGGDKSGSGIGLPLVRTLVHQMGGMLNLQSSLGNGSVFFVNIPVEVVARNPAPMGELPLALPPLGLSVLVVEDMPFNRTLLLDLVRGFGCRVSEAANAARARELLSRQCFDVILLDWDLPDLSGLELMGALRASGELPAQTRVIGVSALPTSSIREKCLEAGMAGFLTKPFSRDALYRILSSENADGESTELVPAAGEQESPLLLGYGLLEVMTASVFGQSPRERWFLQYEQLCLDLQTAMADGSAEAIRKAAHATAGHLAMLQTQNVLPVLRELQSGRAAINPDRRWQLWERFRQIDVRFRAEWKAFLCSRAPLNAHRDSARLDPAARTAPSRSPCSEHNGSLPFCCGG